jgi:hypothetical protein
MSQFELRLQQPGELQLLSQHRLARRHCHIISTLSEAILASEISGARNELRLDCLRPWGSIRLPSTGSTSSPRAGSIRLRLIEVKPERLIEVRPEGSSPKSDFTRLRRFKNTANAQRCLHPGSRPARSPEAKATGKCSLYCNAIIWRDCPFFRLHLEPVFRLGFRRKRVVFCTMPTRSNPEIIPKLISGPVRTPTIPTHMWGCTVRYSDGAVSNIPYVRYIWESAYGRLGGDLTVIQTGDINASPTLENLSVVLRSDTGHVPSGFGPDAKQQPIADAKRELITELKALATTSSVNPRQKTVSFPVPFEDCTDGEDCVILWDFIRSSNPVYAESPGGRQLLFSAAVVSSLPALVIPCRQEKTVNAIRELVNDLKSQG